MLSAKPRKDFRQVADEDSRTEERTGNRCLFALLLNTNVNEISYSPCSSEELIALMNETCMMTQFQILLVLCLTYKSLVDNPLSPFNGLQSILLLEDAEVLQGVDSADNHLADLPRLIREEGIQASVNMIE